MTFGIAFSLVLIGSIVYAIGRTVYGRIRPPLVDYQPAVIPLSLAVRAATAMARDRLTAECNTIRLVPAVLAEGHAVPDEPTRDPGAKTVDLGGQLTQQFGRHRRGDNHLVGAA